MKDKNRLGGWFSKVVELVLAEMIDNAGPQGVAEDIDRRSEPVKHQSSLFSSFSSSLTQFISASVTYLEWSPWTMTSDHTGSIFCSLFLEGNSLVPVE